MMQSGGIVTNKFEAVVLLPKTNHVNLFNLDGEFMINSISLSHYSVPGFLLPN